MDNNINNINNIFKTLYSKKKYFNLYGGSIFMTFFILLAFFILVSYFYVMNNIKPIKRNWPSERCKPSIIPFAGFINQDPHMSTLEYTSKNFSYCINNILTSITSDFMKPIYYVMNLIHNMIKDTVDAVQMIRKKIESVVSNIENIDKELMGRALNFLMPIQYMFIKLRDLLKKINGTAATTVMSIISGYLALKSFLGAFIQIMVIGLLGLTAVIVPLLLFVFTIPVATPLIVLFSIVAGFLLTVIIGLEDILHISPSIVPPIPHCFDGNTLIEMNDGSYKKIKHIKPNQILKDNNQVVSVMKILRNDDMYDFNGVVVTGNHNILLNNKSYSIRDLESQGAKKIDNYKNKYVYCLNTTSKFISINGIDFFDWDDLDSDDLDILRENLKLNKINNHYINHYLQGGFCELTKVKMENSFDKYISNINIGDVLYGNNKVLGIVELSTNYTSYFKHIINGSIIYGGENLIYNNNLFSTLNSKNKILINKKPRKIYHLITEKKSLIINNIEFNDFNSCIEKFLK